MCRTDTSRRLYMEDTRRYRCSMTPKKPVLYLGRTNARATFQRFGIKHEDRFAHLYLIGRTGTGKTTLMETMAMQDIERGHGLAVIDPHGDLVSRLSKCIPAARSNDLVYWNAPDPAQPYGYNPLRKIAKAQVPLAASGLLGAFKKIWTGKEWGVRMEHILRNALLALLEYGDATLPDVLRILTDPKFRDGVIARVSNKQVRAFWTEEFRQYNPRYRQEAIAPIQNKIGAFLADPRLYRMLTTPKKDIRLREIMDGGKILLVNLSKGALGDDSASLLGALLVSSMALAAFSRIDTPEEKRRDFFVYLDEFQSFTTLSVANMISELRKFRVGLTLAHQHLFQLEPEVRHAVLGNAGTLVSFRIGPEDAAVIGEEFAPTFEPVDLLSLPNYSIYIKLMIDGAPSSAFSATTLSPDDPSTLKRTAA